MVAHAKKQKVARRKPAVKTRSKPERAPAKPVVEKDSPPLSAVDREPAMTGPASAPVTMAILPSNFICAKSDK